jgi:hypothetical protein
LPNIGTDFFSMMGLKNFPQIVLLQKKQLKEIKKKLSWSQHRNLCWCHFFCLGGEFKN